MHLLYDTGLAEVRPYRLRHVYVMLHNIAMPTERGRDLFEDQDTRDWDKLTDVMDSPSSIWARAQKYLAVMQGQKSPLAVCPMRRTSIETVQKIPRPARPPTVLLS